MDQGMRRMRSMRSSNSGSKKHEEKEKTFNRGSASILLLISFTYQSVVYRRLPWQ
jgi:hypothetical protein